MADLLNQIEIFISEHKLSESRFGEMVLKDRHFIRQLREGREPRRRTTERVRSFMASPVSLPMSGGE